MYVRKTKHKTLTREGEQNATLTPSRCTIVVVVVVVVLVLVLVVVLFGDFTYVGRLKN